MNRGSNSVVREMCNADPHSYDNFQVQSNVLSMLTRMRQLALHPGLVPTNYLEDLRADSMEGETPKQVVITLEEKVRLQGLLARAIEEFQECPICFSILNEPRITSCAHMFCLPWSVLL
jgi:SWI/SNF-related matrix-associated actin-dependent regulator of chromatin subfamily A3